MSDLFCPSCGDQALLNSRGTAFHTCSGCFKKWVIVEMPPNVVGMFSMTPLTPEPIHELDIVQDIMDRGGFDKGVSL